MSAATAAAKVWPTPTRAEIAEMDRIVRTAAIDATGNDEPASVHEAALQLLWQASRCASPGFGRFDPSVTPVPRQRPEPL